MEECSQPGDIVWYSDQDRQSRNLIEYATFKNLCERKQIKAFDAYANKLMDFSQEADRWQGTIKARQANEELRKITKRLGDGRRYRWNHGDRVHDKAFGYKSTTFDPSTGKKKWQIVEKEAELIRYIFHLYVDEKIGLNGIARRSTKKDTGDGRDYTGTILP